MTYSQLQSCLLDLVYIALQLDHCQALGPNIKEKQYKKISCQGTSMSAVYRQKTIHILHCFNIFLKIWDSFPQSSENRYNISVSDLLWW